MRIVLLAEEAAGLRVLNALLRRKEDLLAVVTSRSMARAAQNSIASVASSRGINVIPDGSLSMSELAEYIKHHGVDILLNVHSLNILPPEVVDAPLVGSFNLHPGPLPQLAGLNAPSWAIYMGEREHAVTLHWMMAGIDTGAIAFAERFPLSVNDTGFSVSAKCVTAGVPLIENLLDVAHSSISAIPRMPQDLTKRRFFNASDVPNDGRIDWNESAQQIAAFVRAADYGPFKSPWGSPALYSNDRVFGAVLTNVSESKHRGQPGEVVATGDTSAIVATGAGALEIVRVRLGDQMFNAADVLVTGQLLASSAPVQPTSA